MQVNRHNSFDFMKPAKKAVQATTAARMKMPQTKIRKVTD
jgi:hypothetical protein